jgi:hypothetical protein
MSLAVALPCGVAAAIAYGASTAVQHAQANTGTGEADARGLLKLLRDPRWLMSIGGDTIGLVLQIIALATGPVVLIQPLLVLSIPVSLPIGRLLGGPRPRKAQYLACLAILGGLGVFFGVLGDPGDGDPLSTHAAIVTVLVVIVAGPLLCLCARGRSSNIRAVVYGTVAGSCFGVVGVLLNQVAEVWSHHGFDSLARADGLVAIGGTLIVGGLGMLLTQISFQVGALAASFPANEASAPVVAVLLGGLLLHEHVPLSAVTVILYVLCLAAIVFGAIRLAEA